MPQLPTATTPCILCAALWLGEEREGARLHKMMGALKAHHATALEATALESKQAEAALVAAQARVTAAHGAQALLVSSFDKRQARQTTLLQVATERETQPL